MRLISQVLSWQSMGVVGPWPFYSIGDANTDWQTFIMRVSLGYFLFDFAWCLVMGSESVIMVMLWAAILGVCIDCRSSSIMSPLSLVLCSAWQRVSAAGAAGAEPHRGAAGQRAWACAQPAGAEFSNPLLQTRWFLREFGAYDGHLALIVDTLFTLTFGLVRFGIGSALLYATLTQVSRRQSHDNQLIFLSEF